MSTLNVFSLFGQERTEDVTLTFTEVLFCHFVGHEKILAAFLNFYLRVGALFLYSYEWLQKYSSRVSIYLLYKKFILFVPFYCIFYLNSVQIFNKFLLQLKNKRYFNRFQNKKLFLTIMCEYLNKTDFHKHLEILDKLQWNSLYYFVVLKW